MNAKTMSSVNEKTSIQEAPEAAVHRSRQAWQKLGLRYRTITPAGVMRFLLTMGALIAIGWLIWQTRVALIPFIVGGVIAYVVLPLVNWLDRFMPRVLAVLLAMGLVLLGLILFLALLLPILAKQISFVYLTLPGLEELRTYLTQIRAYVATLPEPTQALVNDVYAQIALKVRENLGIYLSGLINLTITTLLNLINTIEFVLGFLVVPAWLLTVLNDQRKASPTLNRLLPDWLRSDFWAVLRIFDRAFGTFIRGQLFIGLVVAVLVYLGLELLVRLLGLQGNVRIELLLALIAGLAQLIPSIGPFLGVIPAVLVGLSVSRELGLLIIGLYIIIQWLVVNFVAPRIERSIVDVHPAILILIIVSLSHFGFWWILLAAPVTAVVRDLFRYTYGRLSDPPRPAGILPGEPIPPLLATTQQPTAHPPQRRLALAGGPRRNLRQTGRSDNL